MALVPAASTMNLQFSYERQYAKENMNSYLLPVGASSLLLSSLLLSGCFFGTGGGFGGDFTCWGLWGVITGGSSESSLLLSSELEAL
jgi:predicted small secreted protein